MDTTLTNLTGPIQLIGLAICGVVALLIGARMVGGGSKGFASLIGEIIGLLVGLWIIARPNDFLGLLLKAVGGVQAPAALHWIVLFGWY
jgi:hypothetical protein